MSELDTMRNKPFYVSEISANHLGLLDRALQLVRKSAEAGVSAVKLQTYRPDTMTLDISDFSISTGHSLWGGTKLFDLYTSAMTPWEWHKEIFDLASELGIIAFSSPFDRSAVDFLESIDCPIYKIASMETGDTDLIHYAGSTGKPLIISTGASELAEVDAAVEAAMSGGCKDVTLLVCTSSYPASAQDSHIKRIETLKTRFELPVGLSDHTLGIGVSLAAIALGATVIEKHITLLRSEGGPDSAFSLEPQEVAMLVREGNNVIEALGSSEWRVQESERESRNLRRSLFISRQVRKGEIATRQNVKALRPNKGGPISDINKILGKRFVRDFSPGNAATLSCVE